MTSLLEIKDLDLCYGEAQVLAGVSLEVARGEIAAIVGANGAGKSSLIRAIAGLEKPRAGRIMFAGQDITGMDSHKTCDRGIGQVAEGRQLFPSLTVVENLEMGALLGRARARMKDKFNEVFELFPRLAERKKQPAGTLSGGEQQMLAIGRCLMGCPELIMLDEPSLGLAPAVSQQVLQAIRILNQRGLTLMLVEQNVAVSLKISDRGYVIENGRIVASGSGGELLNDERVRQAYLGM
jgi:branched-chain amino acid transport system ATP-binding protein